MTCVDAEPHVSAVCDGEAIPAEAAKHIRTCEACRAALAEYAQMGVDLRVAAALDFETLPPLQLPKRRRALDFFWRRVAVPRFALAALMIAVVGVGASIPLMRAQPRPLWFQFGYTLDPQADVSRYRVAKSGFDELSSSMNVINGAFFSTSLRVKIDSISSDDVVLRYRAVPGNVDQTANGASLRPALNLPLGDAPAVHYKPGQRLTIPIEGGGTIYLEGNVFEQQPKIAFGQPLELPSNELAMRGPVLISNMQMLANLSGGNASTAQPGTAVKIAAGDHGTFLFALTPFSGAVQGQIEWGHMAFTVNGSRYEVIAAAPLAGGDQPRPVWVRYDATPVEGISIGPVRIGE